MTTRRHCSVCGRTGHDARRHARRNPRVDPRKRSHMYAGDLFAAPKRRPKVGTPEERAAKARALLAERKAKRHARAVADYNAAEAAKVDRWQGYAANAAERSARAFDREHAILDRIPIGQPILLGHHSQARHQGDLRRSDALMRRGLEEAEKAAYWQRKAEHRASGRAVRSADPDAVRKLRAKLAGLEAEREHMRDVNKRLRAGARYTDLAPKDRDHLAVVERMFNGGRTRYDLTNVGAEIRRVAARIKELGG